jgi:ribonuclease P protein component
MPAIGRLKKRREFLAVAASRRKHVSPGMILQSLTRPAEAAAAPSRVGFTASKKVGNAVMRNRAKRRLRELARELIPAHAAQGYDFVLIARAETPQRPYADLRRDLAAGLRRLGAWRQGANAGAAQ